MELVVDTNILYTYFWNNSFARRFLMRMSLEFKDVDFLSLAMKLKLPLWSNESSLKKQNKVAVFSTSDLLDNPEFADVLFPDE